MVQRAPRPERGVIARALSAAGGILDPALMRRAAGIEARSRARGIRAEAANDRSVLDTALRARPAVRSRSRPVVSNACPIVAERGVRHLPDGWMFGRRKRSTSA